MIVKDEDWWLNKLTKDGKDKVGNKKATEFWKARDAITIRWVCLIPSSMAMMTTFSHSMTTCPMTKH